MEIFILFPAAYLVFRNTTFLKGVAYGLIYCVIIAVPLLWWRHWILQFPEGIPVSDWLYNNNGVRFKGAWFYWLFSQRLADLILGYWGLIPFGIGLVTKMKKGEAWFSLLWLAGALAYLIIFAGGNVQHDYYQALIIPVIVWFTAKGFYTFMRGVEGFNKFGSYALAIVCFLFLWAFSWYTIRTYFWINRPEIVEAGKAADALIPKNAKVIAPYNGDTTFLYQINRQGWPEGFDIAKKIAMGAGYYVTVSPTNNDLETRDLANMYTVLVRNDKYAIIDLTRKK
jgi:hypothetical protein